MPFNGLKFWTRTAFLFLFRSGRSTVVLSLMVVAAVSALIFLSALAVGVNDTMIRNSVGLYSGHVSGFNLPSSLKPEKLRIAGTTAVLERVLVRGILSQGNQIETVTMVGVDPAAELAATAMWRKTISGRYPQKDEPAVFISQAVAEKLGVRLGSALLFRPAGKKSPVDLKVSGVYRTGIDPLDRGVAFGPLEVIASNADTWQAAVFLKNGYDPESVIAEYRRNLSEVSEFKSWKELMPDLLQLIDLNYVSMSIVTILVFGVVSLGIACAFIIFIFKNIREYGIMKAMGVTSGEMTLFIVCEVVLMNLAACCVGVLGGALAAGMAAGTGIDLAALTSHNRYFAVSGVIFPRLTLYSLLLPPALSVFFSLVAAVWPAVLVTRKNTADILRIV